MPPETSVGAGPMDCATGVTSWVVVRPWSDTQATMTPYALILHLLALGSLPLGVPWIALFGATSVLLAHHRGGSWKERFLWGALTGPGGWLAGWLTTRSGRRPHESCRPLRAARAHAQPAQRSSRSRVPGAAQCRCARSSVGAFAISAPRRPGRDSSGAGCVRHARTSRHWPSLRGLA